jgi:hypothetical protein
MYLDNVISKARCGYMTVNGINGTDKQQLYDYLSNVLKKNITVLDEKPLTCPGTKIVIWM